MAGLEPNWSLYCLFLGVVVIRRPSHVALSGVKVQHQAPMVIKVPSVATLTLLRFFGGLGGEPRMLFRSKQKGCLKLF